MPRENQTWQSVRDEVRKRIQTGLWPMGALLPKEEDLAIEMGCARVTVNRALRDLAEQGILDRKRKSGTRVAEFPSRNVKFSIPVLRKEIEALGRAYSHTLLLRDVCPPPPPIRAALQLDDTAALHIQSLHMSGGHPFVFEDRWINPTTVPHVMDADFSSISANEWLVSHAPLTRGEMSFSAVSLDHVAAEALGVQVGTSALINERRTWDGDRAVTCVSLSYAPGHSVRTSF
ncbi:MAG: GntR family transcriptional regulator [Pseudomonadota bacterium]